MDLKELSNQNARRHPWETARLKALQRILAPHIFEGITALDEGSGDGFVARNLFSSLNAKHVTAVDSNYSPADIEFFSHLSNDVEYRSSNPEGKFDLVLLLDVLEHVENDTEFLGSLVSDSLVEDGKVLLTVPAFQILFSQHDIFLGHHRRYTVGQLEAVARESSLSVLSSGYLFSTLLIPKLVLYKITKRLAVKGVGHWSSSDIMTFFLICILNLDNSILFSAGRRGMKLPGLSAWALCKKNAVERHRQPSSRKTVVTSLHRQSNIAVVDSLEGGSVYR